MATVVGSLQVDVTNGTATFTFDDAKKQIDGLASSAESAGSRMDYSMRESRESIMLTAEAMGVHLPAGITRVIASLGPLGEALAMALPAAAVVAGIVLIIEAMDKLHAAQEKLKLDSENAGSAMSESLRGLDDKFLSAGIKADELRGDHLAALSKELKLIDNQTLSDLEHEFETLGKMADAVFNDLKSHWYTIGEGSKHATYNLNEYEAKYRELLDTKGDSAATDYLKTQLDYEQKILATQKEMRDAYTPSAFALGDYLTKDQDKVNALKTAGTGITDKEIAAQQELVDTLNAQVSAHAKINATANLEKHTDTQEAHNKVASDVASLQSLVDAGDAKHATAMRDIANIQASIGASGKQGVDAEIAAINENKQAAIQAANDVYDAKVKTFDSELQKAGTNAQAIDEAYVKLGISEQEREDAVNKAEVAAKVATEKAKLAAELESIKTGLEARVKASESGMTAAVKAAQETTEVEKAQNTQQADDIANKEKLGLISKREALAETITLLQQENAARQEVIRQELASEMAALQARINANVAASEQLLNLNGNSQADPKYQAYLTEINALQAQQNELQKQSAASSAAASTQMNTGIQKSQSELSLLANSWSSYFARMNSETNTLAATFRGTLQTSMTNAMNSFNNDIAKSIVEGKNFGQAMRQVAAQFLESMLSAGLKWLENWIIQHTIAAAFANSTAASTFATQKAEAVSLAGANAVASFALAPWPIDMGAPAFGAAMAAAATGFNEGGIVPGIGNSDTVPAMLTPGETVLPQAMTEKLNSATSGAEEHHHWHYSPTNHIKAWDGDDVKDALMSQKSEFIKQTRKEMRRRHK